MPSHKSKLDLLIAVGKPKSRGPDGMTSTSIAEPDQGDGMAPGGNVVEEEEVVEEPMEGGIALPAGFKAPDGIEDGQLFSTTVSGKKMGQMFYPETLGDMPLTPVGEAEETMADEMMESEETQEEEDEAGTEMHPELAKMAKMFKKKKADDMAAKNAFQS